VHVSACADVGMHGRVWLRGSVREECARACVGARMCGSVTAALCRMRGEMRGRIGVCGDVCARNASAAERATPSEYLFGMALEMRMRTSRLLHAPTCLLFLAGALVSPHKYIPTRRAADAS
jgi:hypothetical protein